MGLFTWNGAAVSTLLGKSHGIKQWVRVPLVPRADPIGWLCVEQHRAEMVADVKL